MSLGVAVLQRSEPHSPDPIPVAELEHDRMVPQPHKGLKVPVLIGVVRVGSGLRDPLTSSQS